MNKRAASYETLDKELHRIIRGGVRGRKSLADMLFKVWRSNGDETWLLIHIEVQGDPEDDFPTRMFRYNVRAFDRYNRTVVSLAILTDESPNWRPETFDYGDWDASTGIKFLMRKLIDWMLELPAELNEGFEEELHAFEEERRMPYITSIERSGIGKRIRQGLEQGLQQGLQKGLQKGITAALASKFGKVDKRLLAKVRAITDVHELEALLEAIPDAEKLQEIRDRLPSA